MQNCRSVVLIAGLVACSAGLCQGLQKPVTGHTRPPSPVSSTFLQDRGTPLDRAGLGYAGLGYPFDFRGVDNTGLGWLPGDAGNWGSGDRGQPEPGDGRTPYVARAATAWPNAAPATIGSWQEAAAATPQVKVAQGKNSYALPEPILRCANKGDFPVVKVCPEGWLRLWPDPLR